MESTVSAYSGKKERSSPIVTRLLLSSWSVHVVDIDDNEQRLGRWQVISNAKVATLGRLVSAGSRSRYFAAECVGLNDTRVYSFSNSSHALVFSLSVCTHTPAAMYTFLCITCIIAWY